MHINPYLVTVSLVAIGTNAMLDQFSHVSLEELLSYLHFNHDNKEGGNERIAQFEHVKVEQSVEEISKITIAFQLSKDFVCAYLKQLVDVAEESFQVIVKIGPRVHQHGVEDEAVEENEDLHKDSEDKRERESQVFIEVVHLIVTLLLSFRKLEDWQYLHEGTERRIAWTDQHNQAHQGQEQIPVLQFTPQASCILQLISKDAMFLDAFGEEGELIEIGSEQQSSYYLLQYPNSIQAQRLFLPYFELSVQPYFDHHFAVDSVLSNQLVVGYELIVTQMNGQSQLVAVEQDVPEEVRLQVLEVGECLLY